MTLLTKFATPLGLAALLSGCQQQKAPEQTAPKTNPNKGWFVYFRVYGPEQAAFDGS